MTGLRAFTCEGTQRDAPGTSWPLYLFGIDEASLPRGEYHLGGTGDSCDTVCQNHGRSCVDDDWGVHTQAEFDSALTRAGEDPSVYCSGAPPYAQDLNLYQPATCSSGSCANQWECYYPPSGAGQSCSGSASKFSRLCRCT